MLYSPTFNDHIANPRNVGELADANAVAEETNPVCGDRLRLSLRVHDGRITAARFLAYGCPPTLACGSVMTEMIEGKTLEESMALSRKD
ncbi:MAG: iron-sulfur cluster assembly scaffold protein, partial [Pyrinomonadaceae bacterium]